MLEAAEHVAATGSGGLGQAGVSTPSTIPETLQDSLMAHLDRLAGAKEVAQFGAAIGRDFGYELLAAVSPLAEDELREALEQLVASELVFARNTPPTATYSVKHVLVQDAAYASLLKSRRQELHERIVAVLECDFSETAEIQPEVLAQHCARAGWVKKAVGYWLRAGELAIRARRPRRQ